jgi:hypothetical protein
MVSKEVRMTKAVLAVSVLVLLAGFSPAQEPPSWVNLGDLSGATQVRDLIEVPAYGVALACGAYGGNSAVWKTTDGGQSWTREHLAYGSFLQFDRDTLSGRIWVVSNYESSSYALYYSDDIGSTWTQVTAPPSNPNIAGQTIELVGNYLYFGGTISSPYSISLYRLNTASLEWELVTQYPQCSGITRLKSSNGKLLVFAKDKASNTIRVFSYAPSELDSKAVPVGKALATPAVSGEPQR